MAKTEVKSQGQKMSAWDKICDFYASQAVAVGMIYSLGAAVVIIGAMFKILHLPGAGALLGAGMVTEAILFIMGIFEKPHVTYHWENVYPQLIGDEVKEVKGGSGESSSNGIEGVSTIDEAQIQALNTGIANLSKAAGQLSSLGEVATAGNGLIEKMNAAGKATESYIASQEGLTTGAEKLAKQYTSIEIDMTEVAAQTKSYARNIESINAQLSTLNSVYELQLKDIQAQEAACKEQISVYNAHTEKLSGINTAIEALAAQTAELQQNATLAAASSKEYATAQQKLVEQIASLNKVYGNMLSAL